MLKTNLKTSKRSPGETLLEDVIKPLNLSIPELAQAIKVPPNRLYAIINNKRELTTDTALRLGKYFGTGPEFWLSLQMRHNLNLMQKDWEIINKQIPQYQTTK